jgi:hypothetical protein
LNGWLLDKCVSYAKAHTGARTLHYELGTMKQRSRELNCARDDQKLVSYFLV